MHESRLLWQLLRLHAHGCVSIYTCECIKRKLCRHPEHGRVSSLLFNYKLLSLMTRFT